MSSSTSKVAVVQMTSGPEVSANLKQAGTLLAEAQSKGAALAALPENFALMGLKEGDKLAVAEEDGGGPIQDFLSTTAQRLSMWILGGTIPLRVSGDRRAAAASLLYNSKGERVARYDKIHLFDVDVPGSTESHRESNSMVPGRVPVVVDTPAGRLGLAVCYDMRFPELFRQMSASGAQLFAIPSAFTGPTGRAHWETLLRARAIENLCYVLAPAQSGFHANGRETYGDSLVVDYWGKVLSRLPRGTGVVLADVDLAAQGQARTSFPALSHRVL